MKLLSFIPNTLTFLNLFFGCIAVFYGFNGDLKSLAIFVLLGMLCDFFDGFFARLLNVKSQLGVQLDSLSDLVTFGLSSSVVIFILLSKSLYVIESDIDSPIRLIPYLSFLITIASSYRLAKFNLEINDSYFRGLPTPANALLIVFLPFMLENQFLNHFYYLLENTFFLIFILLISSYLLISDIEIPSLKIKRFFSKKNKFLYLFLIISTSLLIGFKLAAFPIIIVIYVFLGLLRIKF